MPTGSRGTCLQLVWALCLPWSCAGFHAAAAFYGLEFFKELAASLNYSRPRRRRGGTPPEYAVLEVGSRDVNGGMRRWAPAGWQYVGVDVAAGPGVDVVLEDPYRYPFPDGAFIATVSTSAFEHVDFFWLAFLEMLRVTRPDGYVYLNAPSDQDDHSHEVPPDSWRFLRDAGGSLERWGRRGGFPGLRLVQSFVSGGSGYQHHHDCVMVFALGPRAAERPRDPAILEALPETFEALQEGLLQADPCWRDLPKESRERIVQVQLLGTNFAQSFSFPAFCCGVTKMFLKLRRSVVEEWGAGNRDLVDMLWLNCWRGGRVYQRCCLD